MIDNFFLDISVFFRDFPSLFISFLNFILCVFSILCLNKFFGYSGLCCYLVLSTVIANIQVLYATSYEVINISCLLGTVVFCSSFLACDIINEKYGPEKARKAIYLTFVIYIFFILNIILTIGHKPLDYTVYQNFSISKETMDSNMSSIKQVFLPAPRLLIASYITYLVSQMTEIWAFNAVKRIRLIKSNYIKHNIALFGTSVILDTLIFTILGMCLMASEPLSLQDFFEICISAIIIRVLCNMGNTLCMQYMRKRGDMIKK